MLNPRQVKYTFLRTDPLWLVYFPVKTFCWAFRKVMSSKISHGTAVRGFASLSSHKQMLKFMGT